MVNRQRKSPTTRTGKKPVRANSHSMGQGERLVTDTMRVRYRFKDTEFEAEGPTDEVRRHTLEYLSRAPRRRSGRAESQATTPNLQLSLFAEDENTPPLADGGVFIANGIMSTESTAEPIDICTLYTTCAPKTQAEQVMLITYHFQVNLGRETVGYADIDAGFIQLARCGVSTPRNSRMAVKQLIEKERLLYRHNREEGRFALTDQGRAWMGRKLTA